MSGNGFIDGFQGNKGIIDALGYFPVTGQVVAVGRFTYGAVKAIGIALYTLYELGRIRTLDILPGQKNHKEMKAIDFFRYHFGNGLGNMGRAFYEIIPGVSYYFIDRLAEK